MKLQPGDVLLYAGTGFFSRAIQIKTWSRISHVEVYVGGDESVASRDGVGVGLYPLRQDGLEFVLRPRTPFNLAGAMRWFHSVDGQGYDWFGLFAFFAARWQGRNNDKQFCSEFATRFLRRGDVEPFNPETDADSIAPGEFLKSGAFTRTRIVVPKFRRAA